MIPENRASGYSSGYKHEGEDVVAFTPPLKVSEWAELMKYQEIALKVLEKQNGKEKTEKSNKGKPESD